MTTWHTNSNALPLSINSVKKEYDNSINKEFMYPLAIELKKHFTLPSYGVQYPEMNDCNVGFLMVCLNDLPLTFDMFYKNGLYEIEIRFDTYDGGVAFVVYDDVWEHRFEFMNGKSYNINFVLSQLGVNCDENFKTIDETIGVIKLFMDVRLEAITNGDSYHRITTPKKL